VEKTLYVRNLYLPGKRKLLDTATFKIVENEYSSLKGQEIHLRVAPWIIVSPSSQLIELQATSRIMDSSYYHLDIELHNCYSKGAIVRYQGAENRFVDYHTLQKGSRTRVYNIRRLLASVRIE
jgi:hypothetical protein